MENTTLLVRKRQLAAAPYEQAVVSSGRSLLPYCRNICSQTVCFFWSPV